MPNYQDPRAEKLHQEAMKLYERAATASNPDKSTLEEQALAKIREADEIENRTR